MMRGLGVLPWVSVQEWLNVYENIFSDDDELRRRAFDRITVWRVRAGPRIPIAILCTAELVDTQLLSENRATAGSRNGPGVKNLELSCAMSLVRFVNLFKEREMRSLWRTNTYNVTQIGIPEWMVALRHEATHGALPSRIVLESGVKFALGWLKSNYWEATLKYCVRDDDDQLSAETSGVRTHDDIVDLLIDYEQAQFSLLDGSVEDRIMVTDNVQQITKCIQCVIKDPQKSEMLLGTLCEIGYLIPSLDQLSAFNITPGSESEVENLELPEVLLNFWQPMLQCLLSEHSLKQLIISLIESIQCDDVMDTNRYSQDHIRLSWISTLLEIIASRGNYKGCVFIKPSMRMDQNLVKFLHPVINAPTIYTPAILRTIFKHSHGAVPKSTQTKLLQLFGVYFDDPANIGAALREAVGKMSDRQLDSFLESRIEGFSEVETIRGGVDRDMGSPDPGGEDSDSSEQEMMEEGGVNGGNHVDFTPAVRSWSLSETIDLASVPLGAVIGKDIMDDPDVLMLNFPKQTNQTIDNDNHCQLDDNSMPMLVEEVTEEPSEQPQPPIPHSPIPHSHPSDVIISFSDMKNRVVLL